MTSDGPSLFDGERFKGPGRTRRNAPDTSRAAALHGAAGRARQVERVHAYIVERTPAGGCIAEEVADALDLRIQSASARVTDLKRAGLVLDSGNRRRTSSGAYASVLVAAPTRPPTPPPAPAPAELPPTPPAPAPAAAAAASEGSHE